MISERKKSDLIATIWHLHVTFIDPDLFVFLIDRDLSFYDNEEIKEKIHDY